MMKRVVRIAFWSALLFVAAATLGPIELRPESGLPPDAERSLAFALLGVLLALAYPRARVAALALLVAAAGLLEWLQNDVPGRHGRWVDFDVKAVGAVAGALLALGFGAILRRFGAPVRHGRASACADARGDG